MPRIAGINIPDYKRLAIGLTYVYGVGPTNVNEVMKKAKIDGNPKFAELTQTQIDTIRNIIEKEMTVESDLRQIVAQNIRRLKEINSYKGSRHTRNLPANGQRTKTNARTKRGKRVTMGSGKRKSADKT